MRYAVFTNQTILEENNMPISDRNKKSSGNAGHPGKTPTAPTHPTEISFSSGDSHSWDFGDDASSRFTSRDYHLGDSADEYSSDTDLSVMGDLPPNYDSENESGMGDRPGEIGRVPGSARKPVSDEENSSGSDEPEIPSERTKLLPTARSRIRFPSSARSLPSVSSNGSDMLPCISRICCYTFLGLGGAAACIYFIVKAAYNSDKPNLKFEFKTPYASGGTIIITNDGDSDVEITDIQFKINGVIDTTKKGSIYGDLAPWGEATIEKEGTDGVWTTYQINEPDSKTEKVVLKRGETKNCTYVFEKSSGVLNVGTLPQDIKVTIDKKSYNLALAGKCEDAACNDPVAGKHLGGYYTDWDMYQRKYNVEDIPVDKINHIYYAFIGYDQAGNLSLLDYNSDNIQIPMLTQLKDQYPYLNVMLSIGGATKSAAFSALASNPIARENFAKNLVSALELFGFSGIDIDWEYPDSADADNFIALLQTIRSTMDASGQKYKLSIAAPAGKEHIDAIGDQWKQVSEVVDAINVMTYDYNGPWSEKSDYQSPVALPPSDPNGQENSLESTLSEYQQYNVSEAKINVGLPAYFRGVKVANMQNHGMWQEVTGTPVGQFDINTSKLTGLFDYACAVGGECHGGNSLPEDATYLPPDQAPYGNFSKTPMFESKEKGAIFTGDSVDSVKAKTAMAKENGYQGAFFWALSGDMPSKDSLVSAAHDVLSSQETLPTTGGDEVFKSVSESAGKIPNPEQVSGATKLQPLPDLASTVMLLQALWAMGKQAVQASSNWFYSETKDPFVFDKAGCEKRLAELGKSAKTFYYQDQPYSKDQLHWDVDDLKDDLKQIKDQESLAAWETDLQSLDALVECFEENGRVKYSNVQTHNNFFQRPKEEQGVFGSDVCIADNPKSRCELPSGNTLPRLGK